MKKSEFEERINKVIRIIANSRNHVFTCHLIDGLVTNKLQYNRFIKTIIHNNHSDSVLSNYNGEHLTKAEAKLRRVIIVSAFKDEMISTKEYLKL